MLEGLFAVVVCLLAYVTWDLTQGFYMELESQHSFSSYFETGVT